MLEIKELKGSDERILIQKEASCVSGGQWELLFGEGDNTMCQGVLDVEGPGGATKNAVYDDQIMGGTTGWIWKDPDVVPDRPGGCNA